jgi:hypothetical protein
VVFVRERVPLLRDEGGDEPPGAFRTLISRLLEQLKDVAQVLSAIYVQDFMPCSFGGWPERNAHQAQATLNELVAGRKLWEPEVGDCLR